MKYIKTEELVKLKEQGLSSLDIAKKFNMEANAVRQRLYRHYKSLGKKNPKPSRKRIIQISDKKLFELKEKGMTDKEIAEHLSKQGKKISYATVNKRLNLYYANQKKPKPRGIGKNKSEISDNELVELKKKGYTDNAIAEYFTKRGREISKSRVSARLNKYYIKNKKDRPIITLTIEKILELRQKGLSYEEIEKYFTERGMKITAEIAARKVREYNAKQQRNSKTKTEIDVEEVVRLKEKGLLHREIVEYLAKKGINTFESKISRILKEYYEKNGKPKVNKVRKYDDELKEILMSGLSIKEFITEFGEKECEEDIKKRFKKLRLAAVYQKEEKGEFITDDNFIEVLNLIENSPKDRGKYYNLVNMYAENGKCVKGGIDSIRDKCFDGNTDLMMYILLKMNLEYMVGYDNRVYKFLKKQYEQKIDKYLERVNSVEDNRLKHLKESKNSEKAVKSHDEK